MTTLALVMNLSTDLREVLTSHGLDPDTYGPAYGGESVGWDLYNVGPDISIPPGETRLVPTGLRIKLSTGMVGLLRERGSATKSNLILRAGVVDPGYTDEIFVGLTHIPRVEGPTCRPSIDGYPIEISRGQKLTVQLLVLLCFHQAELVNAEDYAVLTEKSLRGSGALGSSDTAVH